MDLLFKLQILLKIRMIKVRSRSMYESWSDGLHKCLEGLEFEMTFGVEASHAIIAGPSISLDVPVRADAVI